MHRNLTALQWDKTLVNKDQRSKLNNLDQTLSQTRKILSKHKQTQQQDKEDLIFNSIEMDDKSVDRSPKMVKLQEAILRKKEVISIRMLWALLKRSYRKDMRVQEAEDSW